MIRSIFAAAWVMLASASLATAATFNIAGTFGGGQLGDVVFDFDVEGDFTDNIFFNDVVIRGTASVTVNTLTSSALGGSFVPDGGLSFSYALPGDAFLFGGAMNGGGVTGGTTDFLVSISNFLNGPISASIVFDAISTSPSLFRPRPFRDAPITVTEQIIVSEVPLPAGVWLLLSGLVGVSGLKRRKENIA